MPYKLCKWCCCANYGEDSGQARKLDTVVHCCLFTDVSRNTDPSLCCPTTRFPLMSSVGLLCSTPFKSFPSSQQGRRNLIQKTFHLQLWSEDGLSPTTKCLIVKISHLQEAELNITYVNIKFCRNSIQFQNIEIKSLQPCWQLFVAVTGNMLTITILTCWLWVMCLPCSLPWLSVLPFAI